MLSVLGTKCPISFLVAYKVYVIVAAVVAALLLLAIIFVGIFSIRCVT